MMKTLFKNFCKCGLIGWCMEIIFTALHCLQKRDMRLIGQTSLWMFPIYGIACMISPLFRLLKKKPICLRGSIYAVCIFVVEYLGGHFLMEHRLCPWNYERSRWNIRKVIRLDYFPNWFLAGLLFEKLLTQEKSP